MVCLRCGLALWSDRPFWQDRTCFADVIATGAALLAIPVLVQMEKANEGVARSVLQVGTVGVFVGVYFVARRFAPAGEPGLSEGM